MGIFSDVFSFSNAIEIGDLQQQNQAQLKLAEFRERADALARQTGMSPMGFFAFEKNSPTPQEAASPWAKTLGVVLGAIMCPFFPVGTILGGIVIVASLLAKERETDRFSRALTRYDHYLNTAEVAVHAQMRAPIFSMDAAGQGHNANHAADIMAAREQAQLAERTV